MAKLMYVEILKEMNIDLPILDKRRMEKGRLTERRAEAILRDNGYFDTPELKAYKEYRKIQAVRDSLVSLLANDGECSIAEAMTLTYERDHAEIEKIEKEISDLGKQLSELYDLANAHWKFTGEKYELR